MRCGKATLSASQTARTGEEAQASVSRWKEGDRVWPGRGPETGEGCGEKEGRQEKPKIYPRSEFPLIHTGALALVRQLSCLLL